MSFFIVRLYWTCTYGKRYFDFKISKIGSNNPMFDFNKLNDVSKNFISKLSKDRVYSMLTEYAKVYDMLLNNKVIFELTLPTNNYRVEKMPLYIDSEFKLGKANYLGTLGETKVTETKKGKVSSKENIERS